MAAKLKPIPLLAMSSMPTAYYDVRDKAMHSLGVGATHVMRSVVRGIFLPVILSRAYTLVEKINLWRGKWSTSSTAMWNEILATDLTFKVPAIDLPVFFMSGRYDFTVSYDLAKAYLTQLRAPAKAFSSFEHSAHRPLFEEPERFEQIILDEVFAGPIVLSGMIVTVYRSRKP